MQKLEKNYIALGKKTEKTLLPLIKFMSIRKDHLIDQALSTVILNSHIKLDSFSPQLSPSLMQQLEKFRHAYSEWQTQGEKIVSFLEKNSASKKLLEMFAFSDRLKSVGFIDNPLVKRMLLNGTLSAITLSPDDLYLKIEQIDKFMQGEGVRDFITQKISFDGSPDFVEKIFLTKNPTVLAQLMQERGRQMLLKDIHDDVLRRILQSNPTIFIKDNETIAAINALYEKAVQKLITPTQFRINFKNLTAQNDHPGHILTTFELAQLVSLSPKLEKDFKREIEGIEHKATSVKTFFTHKIPTVSAEKENITVQLKFLFELRNEIHENKDFFSVKELEKTKMILREAERAAAKFSKTYLDFLTSEFKTLEKEIQTLTKSFSHSHPDAKVLKNAQIHFEQLEQQLNYLKEGFPSTKSERNHLSKLLQKSYRETEKLEKKITQLEEKFQMMSHKIKEKFHEQKQPTMETSSFFKPHAPSQETIKLYQGFRKEFDDNVIKLDALAKNPQATDDAIHQLTLKQFHLNQKIKEVEKQFPNINAYYKLQEKSLSETANEKSLPTSPSPTASNSAL